MAESRGGHRSNVFLAATLVVAGTSVPVRVRNISARGALIDGGKLPPEGTAIELRRGSLAATGAIAWHVSGQCGVRFDADIDVASLCFRNAGVEIIADGRPVRGQSRFFVRDPGGNLIEITQAVS